MNRAHTAAGEAVDLPRLLDFCKGVAIIWIVRDPSPRAWPAQPVEGGDRFG